MGHTDGKPGGRRQHGTPKKIKWLTMWERTPRGVT